MAYRTRYKQQADGLRHARAKTGSAPSSHMAFAVMSGGRGVASVDVGPKRLPPGRTRLGARRVPSAMIDEKSEQEPGTLAHRHFAPDS
ncbi:hypothetical protein CSOJ01_03128 [Colletotrichum sojae]|uniref:Uncharacterized protein n=1 Tax=Colletotrichum sojae TaxID=2175907 RepID=A0A8H6N1L0_9PEZI|nr:hypothetical protein CSOJ01_03128 [Colletotrichum sojae]